MHMGLHVLIQLFVSLLSHLRHTLVGIVRTHVLFVTNAELTRTGITELLERRSVRKITILQMFFLLSLARLSYCRQVFVSPLQHIIQYR